MILNERTGEIIIKDVKINLTKYEMQTLIAINKKRVVTLEEIYEKVYKAKPKELTDYDKRLVYIIVSRLRKKLAGEIIIHSRHSYGYELEVLNG